MLTNRDTSELDISNRLIRLWELRDSGGEFFLQSMRCKVSFGYHTSQHQRKKK